MKRTQSLPSRTKCSGVCAVGSSTQVQSIIPAVTIQCNIISMGKSSLLFDNWIYNVVSRNAFVSKWSLAKSNTT